MEKKKHSDHAGPVSWENGDPLKWGPRVPILPGEWGPGSPSSNGDPSFQENGDPGSPFYREDGDSIGKMGTPGVADHFLGIEGFNPALI